MTEKIAVILFNLGGPDSPAAVRPFLFNLFNDPAIIRLPALPRRLLAWLISRRRAPVAQEIYAKLGGGSPLRPNTQAQAAALQAALGDNARCFIAMRYWHPLTEECVAQVKAYAPDRILLLPLYPQFSTTTTASSLRLWRQTAQRAGLHAPTQLLCCYPREPGFIAAQAAAIKQAYQAALPYGKPRLLFSAHGLPEKIVKMGDPYQWQCEQTAQALVEALALPGLDWVNCYQSRVGPLQWIGPATEAEIRRAGADKVPLIVAPIAFVSEHSETLVELDIEYRHLAEESGVPYYGRVPTVSSDHTFIAGLAQQVRAALAGKDALHSAAGGHACPHSWSGCPWQANCPA